MKIFELLYFLHQHLSFLLLVNFDSCTSWSISHGLYLMCWIFSTLTWLCLFSWFFLFTLLSILFKVLPFNSWLWFPFGFSPDSESPSTISAQNYKSSRVKNFCTKVENVTCTSNYPSTNPPLNFTLLLFMPQANSFCPLFYQIIIILCNIDSGNVEA